MAETMSGPYYYYLAHRTLNDSEPDALYWELPPGTVGAVDLCSRSQEAQPVFVATSEPLDSSHVYLGRGDCREMAVDVAMLSAWESAVGYRPNGERLVDLLWDQLTDGADPSGEGRCKPLMPTVAGRLELWLSGHSLVKSERFTFGQHKHTKQVREVIQRDLRKTFAECCKKKDKKDQEHYRKVLDYHAKQYRADWREFVPSDIAKDVPGPLKHETTVSDDFNRPDGPLGGNWGIDAGSWVIEAGQAHGTAAGSSYARYEVDLSSSNHSVSGLMTLGGRRGALAARYETGKLVGYVVYLASVGSNWGLWRMNDSPGSFSLLAYSDYGADAPAPVSMPVSLSVDGSTLNGRGDGFFEVSATDTQITGNLRCGMYVYSRSAYIDDWQASDLALPPTGNRRRRLLITGIA
jgi:hypothetical protein